MQINGIMTTFIAILIIKLNHKTRLIPDTNPVEIFYIEDEFRKEIEKTMEGRRLTKATSKNARKRAFTMFDGEAITIMIMFRQSRYRDIKSIYITYIQLYCKCDFPETVSFNRFAELQRKALLPMTV